MAILRYPSGSVLCVADVHLEVTAPYRTELFRRFLLDTVISKASALYILGDLFTAWPGDEMGEEVFFKPLLEAFEQVSQQNIPVYVLHGNHDFLMGETWRNLAKLRLIQDGHILKYAEQTWYLLHGDTLCQADVGYQSFRVMVRNQEWQKNFLSLPLKQRLAEIEAVRGRSQQEKALKADGIMDVSLDAVLRIWAEQPQLAGMIHGHTHRPASHQYRINNRIYTRWVLTDWIRAPGYTVLTENGRIFSLDIKS
ncbi:MAG: UDP-2,3-diacylglucosamine diphosphatase [Pseudomonadota bacterium]